MSDGYRERGVFLVGNTPTAVEVPESWDDQSVLSFVAPSETLRRGMLVKSAPQPLRANYTVFWEALPSDQVTYDELRALKPLAPNVNVLEDRCLSESPPAWFRMYRYKDPLTGWIIQQSQRIEVQGSQLYTVTLTADPMSYRDKADEVEASTVLLEL